MSSCVLGTRRSTSPEGLRRPAASAGSPQVPLPVLRSLGIYLDIPSSFLGYSVLGSQPGPAGSCSRSWVAGAPPLCPKCPRALTRPLPSGSSPLTIPRDSVSSEEGQVFPSRTLYASFLKPPWASASRSVKWGQPSSRFAGQGVRIQCINLRKAEQCPAQGKC